MDVEQLLEGGVSSTKHESTGLGAEGFTANSGTGILSKLYLHSKFWLLYLQNGIIRNHFIGNFKDKGQIN